MPNVPENPSQVNEAWTSAVDRYRNVKGDLSAEAALKWLYSGAGRVSFTDNSRDSIRSAVTGLMEILSRGDIPRDAECLVDVRIFHDELDSLYDRLLREKPHLSQPRSYRTRPGLLFKEFLRWLEAPAAYRPRKATRGRRNGNGSDKAAKPKPMTRRLEVPQTSFFGEEQRQEQAAELGVEPQAAPPAPPAPAAPKPIINTGLLSMPLPGGRVFSYTLPEGLSRSDVERIRIQLLLGVEDVDCSQLQI
jgi:hypothetical protein